MTQVLDKEEVVAPSNATGDYAVLAHNNDITKFGDVVGVLIISCGYDEEKAQVLAGKIHSLGKALVYWGSKPNCETIIDDLSKIGVAAELVSMIN
jgi:ATP-dependent Clp protease adapter protein ClpS